MEEINKKNLISRNSMRHTEYFLMIKKKLIMIVMEPWKIMDNDDLVEDLANDLM